MNAALQSYSSDELSYELLKRFEQTNGIEFLSLTRLELLHVNIMHEIIRRASGGSQQ